MGLRRSRAAALALVALGLAACGRAGAARPSSTTAPAQDALVLQAGGTVTVAVPRLPSEFNPNTPAGANSVTAMVMAQVWPQPFVVGPSLEPTPGPGLLAQAEPVGLNPQTVVYTLNPKARWSDGVPITAADFAYYWHEQLAVGPELPATDPLAGYEDIKSITGSDHGRSVTVVFKAPYADWEALFTNLVPAHIARRYGWASAFSGFSPARLVSGGPFAVTRVVPGRELVLSRNPRYWGAAPHLAHIVFRVVRGELATAAALERGAVDLAALPPAPELADVVARSGDLVASQVPSPTLWQLAFNVANPTLTSPVVREAIGKAIDRHQLVSNTVGFATPFGATAGNRLYLSGAPGSQGNDSSYSLVDVSEADQLLIQAGYSLDSQGFVETPTGSRLVLTLVGPSGNPLIRAVESELQAQLLQAGITLRVRDVAPAKLLGTLLPTGRYQLALAPYLASPFPSTTARLYTSPVGPTPVSVPAGSSSSAALRASVASKRAGDRTEPGAVAAGAVTRDVLGYDNSTIDSLFAQAIGQLNASSEADVYNEIDTRLWSDLPTLPLFQMPQVLVSRVDIVNVTSTPTWVGPLWNAEDWAIQLNPPPTVPTSTSSGS